MNSELFTAAVRDIEIPEEYLTKNVKAILILKQLEKSEQKISPIDTKAEKGDFALCRVNSEDQGFCIGNTPENPVDTALVGRKAGDKFTVSDSYGEYNVEVISVKRSYKFDSENGDYKALKIDGVSTEEEYLEHYINTHRQKYQAEQIQSCGMEILNLVIFKLTENIEVTSPDSIAEMEEFAKRSVINQRETLLSYFKGDTAQYEAAMENSLHKGSVEANEQALADSARQNYKLSIAIEPILAEIGENVTEEQYEAFVKISAEACSMDVVRYRELNPYVDYRVSKSCQKLSEMIINYYTPLVKVAVTM